MKRSFLITGVVIYFAVLLKLFGEVQVGDNVAQVEQALGLPVSRGKVGDTQTLNYQNGTKITLRNGVVTDVSVRGQITIGKTTKVIEVQQPAQPPVAVSAPESKNKVADESAKKPEPTPAQAEVGAETPAQTKIATTTKPAAVQTGITSAKSTAASPLPKEVEKFVRGAKAFAAGFLIVFAVLSVAMYAFFSYCFKLICEKAGHEPGALVWVPIAQFIPLLRVAGMQGWMLVLMFIPVINFAFALMLWAKICAAREKSPWLAALLLVPLANFLLIPYLAFSAANESLDEVRSTDAGAKPPTDSAAKNSMDQVEAQPPPQPDSGETVPDQPAMAS